MGLDAARVLSWLTKDARDEEQLKEYTEWVESLDPLRPTPVVQPDDVEGLLAERLGAKPDDIDDILRTRLDPERDPELWWLLERTLTQLLEPLGTLPRGWWKAPHLPEWLDTKGRFFYVHVFLAALPAARKYHQEKGIPDDISWATFEDLGRQIAIYRRINGRGGLDVQFWFTLHFRGLIYDFGRLQFNRGTIVQDEETLEKHGAPYKHGDFVLGVHIPEKGPMTPEACDESFARAKEFYATFYPEESYELANCGSWLMDTQLEELLPADSNIVRFQRRFTVIPESGWDGDSDVFQFVFRLKNPRVEDLPRRTSLERAIVAHLESGKHFRARTGWVRL